MLNANETNFHTFLPSFHSFICRHSGGKLSEKVSFILHENGPFFGIFIELLSKQNVDVARFSRHF